MSREAGGGGLVTMMLFLALMWTQLLITGERLLSVVYLHKQLCAQIIGSVCF